MQVLGAAQVHQYHTGLHSLLALANEAAALGPDMSVADEPGLSQLCAERSALDARIREKQRTAALEKGLEPINPVDVQGVLHIIFQSSIGDTKRGMVQKNAGAKADVYSRILDYRVSAEIAQMIPKREELVQVFGDDFRTLAAPLRVKINQVIPRVRCLLAVATEVLALRAALKEEEAEVRDCHAQIEFGLGLSGPVEVTRGRRSKLDASEVQDIAYMKGQGLTNQAVLELVNAKRAEFGESPIGKTAIKEIPALVAKQRISDQITKQEPKALSGVGRGASAHRSMCQSDSDAIIVPDLSEADCLAMAEEAAIRDVWGVDEGRGICFDSIERYRPSKQVRMYEKQFAAWKEVLNI